MTWSRSGRKKQNTRVPKIISRHLFCHSVPHKNILDTDLSFSGRRASISPRNLVVTTERLVLRDYTQETNFVLDTFVVITNGFHEPHARTYGDLRVKVLPIAARAFYVTRRSEEICEIFDLKHGRGFNGFIACRCKSHFEVITDIERVECACCKRKSFFNKLQSSKLSLPTRKVLLIGKNQHRLPHQKIVGHDGSEDLLRPFQLRVVRGIDDENNAENLKTRQRILYDPFVLIAASYANEFLGIFIILAPFY